MDPKQRSALGYVGVEALWYLLDGQKAGWERRLVSGSEPHWFLYHVKTGTVLDPMAEHYSERPDYESGRPAQNEPIAPSKRAAALIASVQPQLQKSDEEDEFASLAKTVGYIVFPRMGVESAQEPMTYGQGEGALKRGKKGRAIFGARYQLAADPRENGHGGIKAGDPGRRRQRGEDMYDVAKQRGYGVMGTPMHPDKPMPSTERTVSGVAMAGKVHGLVGTRAHEGQHSVFGQLAQKYGGDVRDQVVGKLIAGLTPEGLEAGKRVMGVSGYGLSSHPEEFITSHQQFLTDEKSRKNIYKALGIEPVHQREFFKLMRRNFEQMREIARSMKPTRGLKPPRLRGKMRKSEDDLQKSITAIPAGKILALNPTTHESLHDYSHVLHPPLQQTGYRIRIQHVPRTGSVIARAYDPFGKQAGSVTTYHSIEDGQPVLGVDTAFVKPQHRGVGIGTALYEANYAFAARKLGVRRVVGSEHSEEAQRVHQALARKHGIEYEPEQRREGGGPYDYMLKTAIDEQVVIREGGDKEHELVKFEPLTKSEGPYIWDTLLGVI